MFIERKNPSRQGCDQSMRALRGMPLRLVPVIEALIVNIKIFKDRLNQCYHIFAGPVILRDKVRDP